MEVTKKQKTVAGVSVGVLIGSLIGACYAFDQNFFNALSAVGSFLGALFTGGAATVAFLVYQQWHKSLDYNAVIDPLNQYHDACAQYVGEIRTVCNQCVLFIRERYDKPMSIKERAYNELLTDATNRAAEHLFRIKQQIERISAFLDDEEQALLVKPNEVKACSWNMVQIWHFRTFSDAFSINEFEDSLRKTEKELEDFLIAYKKVRPAVLKAFKEGVN